MPSIPAPGDPNLLDPAGAGGVPTGGGTTHEIGGKHTPPIFEGPQPTGPRGPHGIPTEIEQHTALGTTARHPVPYNEGAEWGPAADPSRVPELQGELVAAGLLNPKDVRYGVWDQTSANAYKTVLAFANAYGMNDTDALKVLAQNPKQGATSGASKPGPYSLTNPVDVKAAYRDAAQKLMGGGLPKGEDQAFADYYRGQEQNAYKNLGAATTNGTLMTTAAPSAPNAAEDYILSHDQKDVVSYDMALRTMQFQQALKEL